MNNFYRILIFCVLTHMSALYAGAQNDTIMETGETILSEEYRSVYSPSALRFGDRRIVSRVTLPDSVDVVRHQKKNFWRAGAETIGFNIGLWAFDRYVLKGHYAYISWNTIKENFRHGFEWDDDHLHTNMFDHPYNGSLFFNAGRSNGFNFWQSELFAIGGSAMWEMFMECEYPSTNDIIATPIGGAAIGEVLYRTSDMITDDRATGGERFGREFAAFLVNPMRGLTRIVTGDAWKKRTTSGRRFGIPPISVDVSLGGRCLLPLNNGGGTKVGAVAEVNIEYGDRYAENAKAPYDWFTFFLGLQAVKTQPLLSRVEIVGRLLSKEVLDKKNLNMSVGMYQHFDFFDSDTIKRVDSPNKLSPCVVPYKFGTPASLGAGTMAQYKPANGFVMNGFVHANAVILGGVLTDFYRDYHRNYNWGSGFSIKAGLNCSLFNDRLLLDIKEQFYKLYTWQGYDPYYDWSLTPDGAPVNIQGDRSNSGFNHFQVRVGYRLLERLYLSGQINLYTRTTNYDFSVYNGSYTYFPRIESKQMNLQLMLTYKI